MAGGNNAGTVKGRGGALKVPLDTKADGWVVVVPTPATSEGGKAGRASGVGGADAAMVLPFIRWGCRLRSPSLRVLPTPALSESEFSSVHVKGKTGVDRVTPHALVLLLLHALTARCPAVAWKRAVAGIVDGVVGKTTST
jgi:hypothetical protein